MDRTACVDVPALPLQLLRQALAVEASGDWRGRPVAVVDQDKPQGVLLWVNEAARRGRILPGMRYGAALALDAELRAGVVSAEEIADAVAVLTGHLWRFSPQVEPAADEPGVFWLDASGILPLYASYEAWGQCIRSELAAAGFAAVVAVGFTRFGSYAAARALGAGGAGDSWSPDRRGVDRHGADCHGADRHGAGGRRADPGPSRDRGVVAFGARAEEAARVREVPIDRLGFLPKLRDTLHELGVDRLGQFVDLPAAGIRRRFGKVAHDLHALARSDAVDHLAPVPLYEPLERSLLLDRPEADLARLLAGIESLLAPLLAILARRQHAVRRLHLRLVLDDNTTVEEELEPAEPTRDRCQLLELVGLRLGGAGRVGGAAGGQPAAGRGGATGAAAGSPLSAGVNEVHLDLTGVPQVARQPDLFTAPPRDLAAARRALARLRAEFGEAAVVQAYLQDGHLPEARFGLAAFGHLDPPRPRPAAVRPMVRRFFPAPIPLPMRSKHEPDGWILDFADGPVEEVIGPHVIHGGWWLREVRRDYYYVRTRNGRWLWLYHDRRRRRWFLQGEVE